MSVLQETRTKASSGAKRSGRLFVLELSGDRIHSMNPDGSDRKIIVTDCRYPDGIAVDVQAGHIYWTNMGIPNLNDGSIERPSEETRPPRPTSRAKHSDASQRTDHDDTRSNQIEELIWRHPLRPIVRP